MFEREEDQPGQTPDSTPETPDPGTPGAPGQEGEQEQEDAGSTSRPGASTQDPTAGMSIEQERDYWKKRYGHTYSAFEREKAKRKEYQTGGIAGKGKQLSQPTAEQKAPEDLENVSTLKDFYDYAQQNITKSLTEKWTEEKLDDRFSQAERTARQKYTGDDPSIPDYDEIVDQYVAPLIDKQPAIYQILRRSFEDPAEAAYLLGFMMKYGNLDKLRDALTGQATDKVVKNINGAARRGATVQGRGGGKQPVLGKVDYNSMPFEDFEAEIEKVKAGKA